MMPTIWLASVIATEKPLSNYLSGFAALSAANFAISEIKKIYEPSKDFYTIVSFRSDVRAAEFRFS